MTTEQLAALKVICEKATPGPRKTFMQSGPLLLATPGGYRVYAVRTPDKVDHEANAEHAAAFDPSTCLELLEEVERLRDLCRSALAIGRREGNATNWTAFTSKLERAFKADEEQL